MNGDRFMGRIFELSMNGKLLVVERSKLYYTRFSHLMMYGRRTEFLGMRNTQHRTSSLLRICPSVLNS